MSIDLVVVKQRSHVKICGCQISNLVCNILCLTSSQAVYNTQCISSSQARLQQWLQFMMYIHLLYNQIFRKQAAVHKVKIQYGICKMDNQLSSSNVFQSTVVHGTPCLVQTLGMKKVNIIMFRWIITDLHSIGFYINISFVVIASSSVYCELALQYHCYRQLRQIWWSNGQATTNELLGGLNNTHARVGLYKPRCYRFPSLVLEENSNNQTRKLLVNAL